jgi:hypothetical protein
MDDPVWRVKTHLTSEADVREIAESLRKMAAQSLKASELPLQAMVLGVAADEMEKLVRDRDMALDRCLAAAKQCDEMTLRLQALEARPAKAKDK